MECSTPIQKYKTGDILVVGTWPVPIFDHFAIVFYRNGVGYVAHNSFRSKKIIISGLDQYVAARKVRRVIHTDTTDDEYIYNKTKELNAQGKAYDFFGYNCESYVRDVCGCDIGMDQRKQYLLLVAAIVIVGIIIGRLTKQTT